MNQYVSLALLLCVIVGIITSIVFKLLRNRLATQMSELVTIGLFIAYTSQYAYLISYITHISVGQIIQLLLFVVAVMAGVYKIISIIIKR